MSALALVLENKDEEPREDEVERGGGMVGLGSGLVERVEGFRVRVGVGVRWRFEVEVGGRGGDYRANPTGRSMKNDKQNPRDPSSSVRSSNVRNRSRQNIVPPSVP